LSVGSNTTKDRCDILALLTSKVGILDSFAAECRKHGQTPLLGGLLRIVEMAGDELDYVLGKPQTQQSRWRVKREMIQAIRVVKA